MGTLCECCGRNIMALPVRADLALVTDRTDLVRQLRNGVCDPCSRLRITAAVDYIRAADAVRVLAKVGIGWEIRGGFYPDQSNGFAALLERVKTAEHRCEELKMWPRHGGTKRPPWFYGDERGNAR